MLKADWWFRNIYFNPICNEVNLFLTFNNCTAIGAEPIAKIPKKYAPYSVTYGIGNVYTASGTNGGGVYEIDSEGNIKCLITSTAISHGSCYFRYPLLRNE